MDKVKVEIEKAKEQLDGLSTAVNRETLVLESLKNELKTTTKELSNTVSSLEVSKEEVIKLKSSIKDLKDKLKEQEDITSKSIKYLKGEEEALKSNIATLNKELEQSIADSEKLLQGALSGLKKDIKINEESLIKLQLSVSKFADQNLLLKEENKSLSVKNSELLALDNIIKEKQDEISKLDILKEEKTKAVFDVSVKSQKEIDEKLALIAQKEIDSVELDTIINDKIKLGNDLDLELEKMTDEKLAFVKEKMALQTLKEELTNREEFIKEKYQQAGIIY